MTDDQGEGASQPTNEESDYHVVIYEGSKRIGFHNPEECEAYISGLPVEERSEVIEYVLEKLEEFTQTKEDWDMRMGEIAGKQLSHEKDTLLNERFKEARRLGKKIEEERRDFAKQKKALITKTWGAFGEKLIAVVEEINPKGLKDAFWRSLAPVTTTFPHDPAEAIRRMNWAMITRIRDKESGRATKQTPKSQFLVTKDMDRARLKGQVVGNIDPAEIEGRKMHYDVDTGLLVPGPPPGKILESVDQEAEEYRRKLELERLEKEKNEAERRSREEKERQVTDAEASAAHAQELPEQRDRQPAAVSSSDHDRSLVEMNRSQGASAASTAALTTESGADPLVVGATPRRTETVEDTEMADNIDTAGEVGQKSPPPPVIGSSGDSRIDPGQKTEERPTDECNCENIGDAALEAMNQDGRLADPQGQKLLVQLFGKGKELCRNHQLKVAGLLGIQTDTYQLHLRLRMIADAGVTNMRRDFTFAHYFRPGETLRATADQEEQRDPDSSNLNSTTSSATLEGSLKPVSTTQLPTEQQRAASAGHESESEEMVRNGQESLAASIKLGQQPPPVNPVASSSDQDQNLNQESALAVGGSAQENNENALESDDTSSELGFEPDARDYRKWEEHDDDCTCDRGKAGIAALQVRVDNSSQDLSSLDKLSLLKEWTVADNELCHRCNMGLGWALRVKRFDHEELRERLIELEALGLPLEQLEEMPDYRGYFVPPAEVNNHACGCTQDVNEDFFISLNEFIVGEWEGEDIDEGLWGPEEACQSLEDWHCMKRVCYDHQLAMLGRLGLRADDEQGTEDKLKWMFGKVVLSGKGVLSLRLKGSYAASFRSDGDLDCGCSDIYLREIGTSVDWFLDDRFEKKNGWELRLLKLWKASTGCCRKHLLGLGEMFGVRARLKSRMNQLYRHRKHLELFKATPTYLGWKKEAEGYPTQMRRRGVALNRGSGWIVSPPIGAPPSLADETPQDRSAAQYQHTQPTNEGQSQGVGICDCNGSNEKAVRMIENGSLAVRKADDHVSDWDELCHEHCRKILSLTNVRSDDVNVFGLRRRLEYLWAYLTKGDTQFEVDFPELLVSSDRGAEFEVWDQCSDCTNLSRSLLRLLENAGPTLMDHRLALVELAHEDKTVFCGPHFKQVAEKLGLAVQAEKEQREWLNGLISLNVEDRERALKGEAQWRDWIERTRKRKPEEDLPGHAAKKDNATQGSAAQNMNVTSPAAKPKENTDPKALCRFKPRVIDKIRYEVRPIVIGPFADLGVDLEGWQISRNQKLRFWFDWLTNSTLTKLRCVLLKDLQADVVMNRYHAKKTGQYSLERGWLISNLYTLVGQLLAQDPVIYLIYCLLYPKAKGHFIALPNFIYVGAVPAPHSLKDMNSEFGIKSDDDDLQLIVQISSQGAPLLKTKVILSTVRNADAILAGMGDCEVVLPRLAAVVNGVVEGTALRRDDVVRAHALQSVGIVEGLEDKDQNAAKLMLTGLGPVSDMLVGRLDIGSPNAQDALKWLLSKNRNGAMQYLEQWRIVAIRETHNLSQRIEEFEKAMYGKVSFYKRKDDGEAAAILAKE
ncbi:MAG: hypothetical protein M1836_006602 [Candelina mexicana]|nr:MAG: hypothetical protein M1836_006602 [Candelina mexicana]